MHPDSPIPNPLALQAENAELKRRLDETEETLRAIQTGEVDALMVDSPSGPQIFVLQSADAESNRFRSDILSKVSDAVIAIDREGRAVYLNAAAEQQYEITASEALGRTVTEIYECRWLTPESKIEAETALRETGHWLGRNIHILQNGREFQVESSVSNLTASHGGISGCLNVIRDITARVRSEETLRRNEALFAKIIDQAPGGVFVINAQFRMQQLNAGARAVFANAEPVVGRDHGEIMEIIWGPQLGREIATIFRHTLETGERYVAPRFTEQRHDLGVPQSYDWETQRLTLPSGEHGVVCYFKDVTEQRALEDALVEQASKLEQADRSKDEFLAMLAHELRNPLAPLRNATEILQTEGTSSEERGQARRILARQIENMSRMIDDLLDVSRITEGKIELRRAPVSLEQILTAAASLARAGCAAHCQTLKVTYPAEPIYLLADATRLEQVFGNLLGNACKYSGEGTHIELLAERVAGTNPPEVVVRVRDNGAGIDPQLLPRVFDLFVQATRSLDRAHGGLGIGLALVSRLVKLHGGRVLAKSDGPGHGAEFIVHLPILTEAPLPAAPPPPATLEPARRILIVDDNADAARSMAVIQSRRGHETRTAFSGPEAVAAAAEFHPEVVLLDIGLPGMDGYQVARRVRAMPALANAFLVAMSGYGSADDREEARAAGFDEYLIKPADLEVLRGWMKVRVTKR